MDDAIKRTWASQVVTAETWLVDKTIAKPQKGESKGLWVRSASGTLGYMKPTTLTPGRYRAGYEKIAADLGFQIGVNVPPTLLYVRSDATPTEEKFVSVSLVPAGEIYEWSHFVNVTTSALKAMVKSILADGSAVVALDALLNNNDRGNTDNSLFVFGEDRQPAFLDFSNTMDHGGQWTAAPNNHQVFSRLPVPALFAEAMRRRDVEECAKRISALPADNISSIVNRLPNEFMPEDVRKRTGDWLVWRKDRLVDRMSDWYPGK